MAREMIRRTFALALALAAALPAAADDELPKSLKLYRQVDVPYWSRAVEMGPSRQHRERARRALEASYDRLVSQARTNPEAAPTSTREEFVARYMERYDAEYRARAAKALAEIGTPSARDALEKAIVRVDRPETRARIQERLAAPE